MNKEGISIGVIGPDPIVKKIRETLKSFPSFQPVFQVYQHEDEVPELAEKLQCQAEVLLFSGYLPYRKAKEQLDFKLPVHYVPLTGNGLYRALFRLWAIRPLKRVSIDTLPKQMVDQTVHELGTSCLEAAYFDYFSAPSDEEIVRFHLDHFYRGACDAALTGIQSVADRLTEMNVPNEWILPTVQDITISLERALLSTETRRRKESQIVVGLITIDDSHRMMERRVSEHELQKVRLEIHRMVLDYVESLDGHLTSLGGDEYLFFTTRGTFERVTRGYKYIPLLREVNQTFHMSLSLGVGFGLSANEAGTHARLALLQAKESGGNICFIVREDRSVIGPVEMAHPMVYDLSVTDPGLLKKAKEAGMTAAYMSKLMAQVARAGKMDYTAQELATILGITVRSTHRILLQWMDAGLVTVVGAEKITSRGRPRQIYRLSFLADPKEMTMRPPLLSIECSMTTEPIS
ncbi:hypothetical protein [Lihuaxuella thermophila]|uniref:GGDEF domain-containing protein n=1 Tax=Lihuaxuella thermophila TaxID=1173111 RepID=A0A1H8E1Q7_9BACL|nr:hypothetical protein [Lihuaxuella thermophila]SEN13519.1 hypothetical protein SAMN05444955_10692 [Lihuaxuella thermophila]